ncbi:MAG: protein kinase [Chlamydiales bacterium]|nr:protein kinase [Chlamydiales bacterium]
MNLTFDHSSSYQILRSLGKGGMGEVFLAQEGVSGRLVALKRMRSELKDSAVLRERFLREARVTATLTHPSIIPVFNIYANQAIPYFTMPYVEGETLKKILKTAFEEEKVAEPRHPIGCSIIALTRIFLSVCEAIAYTHSKGVLHRDLKPDNIIVGKYGEVLILDWGLADFIGQEETSFSELLGNYQNLTRPGKVPGTLNYLAPERAKGEQSTPLSDIYSLGVILYQMLTLRLPFYRTSLRSFLKTMHLEKWINPTEIAPYRDISVHLVDIAKRCLQPIASDRFESVDDIIVELKKFIEGKPEWILTSELNVNRKQDWAFQENILLTKHLAITRSPEVMEWLQLMISKDSFTGNIRIETEIYIQAHSEGVGVLFTTTEVNKRGVFLEGYTIWLNQSPMSCRLFYGSAEVMTVNDLDIPQNIALSLQIDKMDNHLYVYLNHTLICHYISLIPLPTTQLALVSYDNYFTLSNIRISLGSQNAMINCLAIPDAFLSNKNYSKALLEYRRIGNSFSGRMEGREALFRAGITLIKYATVQRKSSERERLYLFALDEFSKLRHTPGAPLEYLGKSLVYEETQEIEEEIKCLEICIRKYSKHPLFKMIVEQIMMRLHQTSSYTRIPAYHFALLALRHLPKLFTLEENKRMVTLFNQHLELIPFFTHLDNQEKMTKYLDLSCQLAFWLAKPITLIEILENTPPLFIATNAFFGLLAMGFDQWVGENLYLCSDPVEAEKIQIACLGHKKGFPLAIQTYLTQFPRAKHASRELYYLLDQAILKNKIQSLYSEELFELFIQNQQLAPLGLELLLLQNRWNAAEKLITSYHLEDLQDDSSVFYPLIGCWLCYKQSETKATSYLKGAIDAPFPTTKLLLSYFLQEKITNKAWKQVALTWEKISLFRQLRLFFHCAGNQKKAKLYSKRIHKEIHSIHVKYHCT